VKRLHHNLGQKEALPEDIEYERAGGGEGHASLSAIPLADGERLLGSMVIVDDATRAAAMAEERLRELAGQRAGRRNQRPRRENAE